MGWLDVQAGAYLAAAAAALVVLLLDDRGGARGAAAGLLVVLLVLKAPAVVMAAGVVNGGAWLLPWLIGGAAFAVACYKKPGDYAAAGAVFGAFLAWDGEWWALAALLLAAAFGAALRWGRGQGARGAESGAD